MGKFYLSSDVCLVRESLTEGGEIKTVFIDTEDDPAYMQAARWLFDGDENPDLYGLYIVEVEKTTAAPVWSRLAYQSALMNEEAWDMLKKAAAGVPVYDEQEEEEEDADEVERQIYLRNHEYDDLLDCWYKKD